MKVLPSVYYVSSNALGVAAEIRTKFLPSWCFHAMDTWRLWSQTTDSICVWNCFLLFDFNHSLVRLATVYVARLVHALLVVMLINGSKYDSILDLLTWSPALSPAYHRLLFLMPHLWSQRLCRPCVRTMHIARCLQQGTRTSSSGQEHKLHVELLCGAALRPALLTTQHADTSGEIFCYQLIIT